MSIENCYGYDSISVVYLSKYLKYSIIIDASCSITGKLTRLFDIDNVNKAIKSTLPSFILAPKSSIWLSSNPSDTKYSQPIAHSESTIPFSDSIISSHNNIFNGSSNSFIVTQSSLNSYRSYSTILTTRFIKNEKINRELIN